MSKKSDFIIENGVLTSYIGSGVRVTIPSDVTDIGDWAFYGCTSIASIFIPDGVKSIGDCAFSYCSNLKKIHMPKSLIYFGNRMFPNCPKLISKKGNYKIGMPIGEGIFSSVKPLHEYYVHEKYQDAGELKLHKNGIHYCTNLFEIFNYQYCGEYDRNIRIALCEVSDNYLSDTQSSGRCTDWIIPIKMLTREEVIDIMNGD